MTRHTSVSIDNIRLLGKGITDSFEELCCQLHRRAPGTPSGAIFRRIRGDGGDGGVESTWTYKDGSSWGLQAKFFSTLAASEKNQLAKSLEQAVANYPNLKRYTICLPFVLTGKTGAKSSRPREGQHATITTWIAEWDVMLKALGRDVLIDWWDESEVLERLAATDPSGGLRRYWFDQTVLTDQWLLERWEDAKAQAGARYTPSLNVTTPLETSLNIFANPVTWRSRLDERSSALQKAIEWWESSVNGRSGPDISGLVPTALKSDASSLLAMARSLLRELDRSLDTPELVAENPFRSQVKAAKAAARTLEPAVCAALIEEYGPDADTPGFRQWRAEMQCDFPMGSLDHLRKLLAEFDTLDRVASHPDARLAQASAMVVSGEAGIGKTHALIDCAAKLRDAGQQSIVVFGEDFNDEPWGVIAAKLGLGASLPREELLDALDAAGESTGSALIIIVDALNETQPDRRRWAAWLPVMIEQIGRRKFLKLCVSCRQVYLGECVPQGLGLPTVIHNGFLGREYEAQFAFFHHYEVGLPAEPLLQAEFANPLFLRLVCETLKATGAQAAPVGREGIRSLINLLLKAKNQKAAAECGYDFREGRVKTAMLRLAGAMAEGRTRSLSLDVAKTLVDSAGGNAGALFRALESEALVSVVETPPESPTDDPYYKVRFTFERISDHLIVESLLADVKSVQTAFKDEGKLGFLLKGHEAMASGAGLLEALSVHLPEVHEIELPDAVPPAASDAMMSYFLRGLQWRLPASLTGRTEQLVAEALASERDGEALAALLSLAARPGNRLNAEFLDKILGPLPMMTRDPAWSSLLLDSFSNWSESINETSMVFRLVEAARRGTLEQLPDDVAVLWALALAWFCASPDRRLRDRSTMGLVHIFRARPASIIELIERFVDQEDEYIVERVLVSAYGALLLNPNAVTIHAVATKVYGAFFANGSPPLNVSLRDHGRLLIDLSFDVGCPLAGVSPPDYQPPYNSPWPLLTPTTAAADVFSSDRQRFPQMRLDGQMGLALGSDFARYVVEPRVLNEFDFSGTGITKIDIFRWFIAAAATMGYPGQDDQCAAFDHQIISTFGSGRGKPGWAERLGKKYYWILLRQLVGQVADHLPRKGWSGPATPPNAGLQGMDLRDIDVTDLRNYDPAPMLERGWIDVSPYVFAGPEDRTMDAAWVADAEMPPVRAGIELVNPDGQPWLSLDMSWTWDGKRDRKTLDATRRVFRTINSALLAPSQLRALKKAFTGGLLGVFQQPHDYRGYLGEYPARSAYTQRLGSSIDFVTSEGGIDFENVALLQLRGNEWGEEYSDTERAKSLTVPAVDLVDFGQLSWNGKGGWIDKDGVLQVLDPNWSGGGTAGLIVKSDFIDGFLKAKGQMLVTVKSETKYIAGMSGNDGRYERLALFVRQNGQTKLVDTRLDIESAPSDDEADEQDEEIDVGAFESLLPDED